jgi:hypothetical protein
MTISGKKIAVNFFDLSGDEDYSLIRNPFLKDAQVHNYNDIGYSFSIRLGKPAVFH